MNDDLTSFKDEELLLRQVHPNFIQEERVTSQAFKPTPKDEEQLSFSRSLLTSAKEAFEHYTQRLNLDSVGVWAVSVKEVNESMPSSDRIIYDPTTATPELPEDKSHTVICFKNLSKGKIDSSAKKLAAKARDRGRQHPVE